jgi:hypothetical protein
MVQMACDCENAILRWSENGNDGHDASAENEIADDGEMQNDCASELFESCVSAMQNKVRI